MKKRPKKSDDDFDDVNLEEIDSEEEDKNISPVKYEILTYPADYTLQGLVDKLGGATKSILIPPFQRKFVWTQAQSSKLIESFLLGLPVPPVFLYAQSDNKLLVVDGHQRLKSVKYFFEGFWGEEENGKRPVFRLVGLNEKSPFLGKTFADIEDSHESSFRRLTDAVLRSFVIKQLDPKDDTSIYHVFERLNTGGTRLHSQEIRNCLYHGKFNKLLISLNKVDEWRSILGRKAEDRRRRDVELILRFFALHLTAKPYAKPMTDFLSGFMAAHKSPSPDELVEYEVLFTSTIAAISKALGPKPFHIRAGLNAAAFDAVATAFASNLTKVPRDIKTRFQKLVRDRSFVDYTTYRTTDDEIVRKRISLAAKVLFGAKKK